MAPPVSSTSTYHPPVDPRELKVASVCFPTAHNVTAAYAAQGVATQVNSAVLQQDLIEKGGLLNYVLAVVDDAVSRKDEEALERARFACKELSSALAEQVDRIETASGLPKVPARGSARALFASPLPSIPQQSTFSPFSPLSPQLSEEVAGQAGLADRLADGLLELKLRISDVADASTPVKTKGGRRRKINAGLVRDKRTELARTEQKVGEGCKAMLDYIAQNRIADAQVQGIMSPPAHLREGTPVKPSTASPVPIIATTKGPETPSTPIPTSFARRRSHVLSPLGSGGSGARRKRKG